jgi:cbb3-type cytochrome oxidase maturation protein
MTVIFILIFVSLGIALFFLGGFIWAVKSGQFEDTCTPSLRILTDDENKSNSPSTTKPNSKKP